MEASKKYRIRIKNRFDDRNQVYRRVFQVQVRRRLLGVIPYWADDLHFVYEDNALARIKNLPLIEDYYD